MSFDKGQFHTYTDYPAYEIENNPRVGEIARHVSSVYEGAGGTLWIGDYRGLVRLRPGQEQFEIIWAANPKVGAARFNVANVVGDGANGVWFGNAMGLFHHVGGKTVLFPGQANGLRGEIKPLGWVGDGELWIAGNSGTLSRLQGDRFTHFRHPTGLSDEDVKSFLPDSEGNLWIGTWNGGPNRLQPYQIVNLTTADGLAYNNVRSICEAPDSSVWFATDDGLSHYVNEGFVTYRPRPETAGQRDKRNGYGTVFVDHRVIVWAGSSKCNSPRSSNSHWTVSPGSKPIVAAKARGKLT
jgi:ligand-binding sensor domain-containing protein